MAKRVMRPKDRPILHFDRRDLERVATHWGGSLQCDTSGNRWAVYQCIAPDGHIWADGMGVHMLRVEWPQRDTGARRDAVRDAIQRMGHGVEKCVDPECDFCHPLPEQGE